MEPDNESRKEGLERPASADTVSPLKPPVPGATPTPGPSVAPSSGPLFLRPVRAGFPVTSTWNSSKQKSMKGGWGTHLEC